MSSKHHKQMQGLVKLTYKKPCPNVLQVIHCFDLVSASKNEYLDFTTHQCRGNHKIQVRGMLHDSIGHPHLQFVIVC